MLVRPDLASCCWSVLVSRVVARGAVARGWELRSWHVARTGSVYLRLRRDAVRICFRFSDHRSRRRAAGCVWVMPHQPAALLACFELLDAIGAGVDRWEAVQAVRSVIGCMRRA